MAVIRLGITVIPLAVAFVICLFMAPETKGNRSRRSRPSLRKHR